MERHNEVDEALIRRLKSRDPQALAELYDRYGRMLYGRILKVIRDRSAAEDLTQETMLRIWNGIGGFDDSRACLATWMGTIARNISIDYLRSHAVKATVSLALDSIKAADAVADFEKLLDARSRIASLRKRYERLSLHQKLVIQLSYGEGMSQTEISQRIQRPLGTVKTWIRAALQVLRAEDTPLTEYRPELCSSCAHPQ